MNTSIASTNQFDENNPRVAELLRARELGFEFIRCRAKGNTKAPIDSGWSNGVTKSPVPFEKLVKWVEAGHNVAVLTGEYIVVDIDVQKDGESIDSICARIRKLRLCKTVAVRTGKGGIHLYYKCPVGVTIGNSVGKLAPSVDVRGKGGCAVFPGATHPETGQVYQWINKCSPQDIEFAELPAHIVEKLTVLVPPATTTRNNGSPPTSDARLRAYSESALRAEIQAVATAAKKTRNITLNMRHSNSVVCALPAD